MPAYGVEIGLAYECSEGDMGNKTPGVGVTRRAPCCNHGIP